MDIITKKSKIIDNWFLFLLAGALLLLYTISRIISLSRRVKDVESRPPVDEIILRGLIRQEVQNHTDKLDALIQQKIENMEVKLEDIEVQIDEKSATVVKSVPTHIKVEEVVKEEVRRSKRRNNNKNASASNETKIVNESVPSHLEDS